MDHVEEHNIRQSLARIEAMLRRQHEVLEKIMSGEDDLKQAIADNAAAMTTAANTISNLAAKIAAGASGQDPDADIEALANQLKAQTAQFNLAVSNATNPAPAPAQNTGGAATVTSAQQAHSDAATGATQTAPTPSS